MNQTRVWGAMRVPLEGLIVVLGYMGMAFCLLYPLFAHPASTVIDPLGDGPQGWLLVPDVTLVIWELAWVCHALATAPWRLFDANSFHPAPLTLAGSEHLLGQLPIFGPFYALSGNPVLANQMNLWLAFALCGAAMYALLRYWGVSRAAALFGGFVYAFFPARAYGTAHAYMTAGQYLPLALLFLDRTVTEQRVKTAIGFAIFLLLQMLCSYYLAYISAIALGGYALGMLCGGRRVSIRGVLLVLGGGLMAAIVVAALSVPYLQLRRVGVVPELQLTTTFFSISSNGLWKNYLYPPIGLRKGVCQLASGTSFYVGLLPLACVMLAVMPRRDLKDRPAHWVITALLGVAVISYVFALGPQAAIGGTVVPLPYGWAMKVVPGFSSMRGPYRFGFGLMVGFAALAGIGFDRALHALRARRSDGWFVSVALVGVLFATAVEYDLLRYHSIVRRLPVGRDLPQAYQMLAQSAPGAVLEIPVGSSSGDKLKGMAAESEYMFFSIFHWHGLLNGYSGYRPPSYAPVVALANSLPNAKATQILERATGLRFVVVHLAKLMPVQRQRWDQPPGLQLVGSFGDDLLFKTTHAPPADLLSALIDFSSSSTSLLGTPLVALQESDRRAMLTLAAQPATTLFPGSPTEVEVVVTNRSAATWPGLVSVGDHLVTLATRWEDGHGRIVAQETAAARLPYDLAAGESLRASVRAVAPRFPGAFQLVVGVAQDGIWFSGTLEPILITVASTIR